MTPHPPPPAVRVFIVEDGELVRRRLIEALIETGRVEVVGYAETEDEAVREVVQHLPDAVIVDIQLKRGSGINVLKLLRAELASPPVLIVLTNYALPQYQKKCLDCGAHYFLDKTTQFAQVSSILCGMRQDPPTAA